MAALQHGGSQGARALAMLPQWYWCCFQPPPAGENSPSVHAQVVGFWVMLAIDPSSHSADSCFAPDLSKVQIYDLVQTKKEIKSKSIFSRIGRAAGWDKLIQVLTPLSKTL